MIKEFIKKYHNYLRYISAAFLILLILPIFFLMEFGGTIGQYIVYATIILFGMFASFEVFQNMNISKYSSIYLSLTMLILIFLPWDSIKRPIDQSWSNNLKGLIEISFNWKGFLILFLASFIPMIIDRKLWSTKNIVIKQTIVVFVIFSISIFVKLAWLIGTYDLIWLLFFCIIPIITDTFGFYGGKYLRRYIFNGAKLAPKISPKKTWAGFIVCYVFATAFIASVGWYLKIFESTNYKTVFLIIATIFLPIISVVGDLMFSAIKRFLKIKDFSKIIPGHGGLMDRLDAMSLVFVATMFLYLF